MTALLGFFIGQGKTKIMIWLALISNLVNLVLDWILIFGVDPWLSPMGIRGAAIATCVGYLTQSLVLFLVFIRHSNRKHFGTGQWKLNWQEMKLSLRIGVPQGIYVFVEMFGWYAFYAMMSSLSPTHITVSSICQSIVILLAFFGEGLAKGATAIAGNLIGARNKEEVSRLLRSGLILTTLFSLCICILFFFDPTHSMQELFYKHIPSTMHPILHRSLILTLVYLFFEIVRWLLGALLAAAGDTLFLMTASVFSVWLFLLAPLYFIVVPNSLDVEYAWGLGALYAALFALVYLIRFVRGAWKEINLIDERAPSDTMEQA
jgi:MATE family multidrug resistance protein